MSRYTCSMIRTKRLWVILWLCLPLTGGHSWGWSELLAVKSYAQPEFPFLESVVDARNLGQEYPTNNLTPRGLCLKVGIDAYLCFDTDLLRMSLGWRGGFLEEKGVAATSYYQSRKKEGGGQKNLPRILGKPVFANGTLSRLDASRRRGG